MTVSCQKKAVAPAFEEQCVEFDHQTENLSLKRNNIGCRGDRPNEPLLSAHFLQQSLHQEICFEDVVYNSTNALSCAPGPFLIEGGSVVDVEENIWELSSTPDYLVWHLDNKNSKESFYITNRQGFPIRAQTIKLQNEQDATMVLLPKNELVPGTKYYIYLIVEESKQTWIQPVAIAVHNSKRELPQL